MRLMEKDRKLMRYLLGELSTEERTRIEDLYVSDEDSYEHLLMAEDEIIDAYVRGRMSDRERNLFEQNFLCSQERRDRVRIAGTLARYADAHSSTRAVAVREKARLSQWVLSLFAFEGTAMRMAMAAAIVVVLLGGGWGWVELMRLRSGFDSLRSEQIAQQQREEALQRGVEEQKRLSDQLNRDLDRERSERGRVEQELAKLREQQSQPVVFSLGPGLTERPKGAPPEGRKVTIPRGREMVRFQLDLLVDEYDTYLVIIRDERDQIIWQGLLQSARTARGPAVFVRLPSRLFVEGRYDFTLSGTRNKKEYESISEFPISVSRK